MIEVGDDDNLAISIKIPSLLPLTRFLIQNFEYVELWEEKWNGLGGWVPFPLN